MKIIQSILTKNACYKAGRKITVKGLMLHSVGCNQPSAQAFVDYWNGDYDVACVHAFIDANSGDVYQTLPWNHRGWHAGGSANNTHIGVEMCEPKCLDYIPNTGKFTCSDIPTAKAMVQRVYDSAVVLFAHLCEQYKLDPLADGVIISHKEGYKRGVACNHGDPEHLWNGLGMGYTMDGFRKAVKAAMKPAETPKAEENVIYRVQVGAYSVKKYADEQLKRVKAAGFDACLIPENNMYKVQVGAYSVKANAEKQLAKVKAAGFGAFIATITKEPAKKTIEQLAKEVINGDWGNGVDRKNRLTKAGYSYAEVQKKVNELLM